MSEDMSTMPLLDKNHHDSTVNVQSINYTKGDIENRNSYPKSIQNQESQIDNASSVIKGKIENFDNPIERYNLVINEYNNEINKIDDVSLSLLKESFLVGWFNKIFTKPSSKWFACLFLLVASGFNLIFFFVFIITFCIFMSNFRTHTQNEKKIPDPFQKMIYCEEMCESLNVSWYYFKLNVEEMNNFSFNFDTMKFIKDRIKDSVVEFMVYDIKFYENYTQFMKVKGRFIRWIFGSLLLIGINAAIVFLIYDVVIAKDL